MPPITIFILFIYLFISSGVLNATPWIRDDFLKVLASKTPGMSPYLDDDAGEGDGEREGGEAVPFDKEYY